MLSLLLILVLCFVAAVAIPLLFAIAAELLPLLVCVAVCLWILHGCGL